MKIFACVKVESQADVDALLAHDPDHWITEALQSYSFGDFANMVVPIEDSDNGVFKERDLINTPRIIAAHETKVAVYMGGPDGGRLYGSEIIVPVFEFDGEEGWWFWISQEDLEDGALS